MNQQIGVSTINYDESGNALSATFEPTIKIESDNSLISQLSNIKNKSANEIKSNAELVFSSWFRKLDDLITDIELSDREEYEVVSEVKECLKYGNDSIKKCVIEFSFNKK